MPQVRILRDTAIGSRSYRAGDVVTVRASLAAAMIGRGTAEDPSAHRPGVATRDATPKVERAMMPDF